ncbi:hypothetical protein [Bdellovibrio sp. HCB2-146]|uniref:hypothetical protein n=1 Tax=Bdellovibrio sp. HCB2-146 TaxID=3394362 RepID=UPI0039BCEAAF
MMKKSLLKNFKEKAPAAMAAVLVLCTFSSAMAANVAMNRTSNRPVTKPKNWSIPLSAETSSTLHKEGSYEREASSSFSLAPSIKFTSNLKLATSISVWKEHTGPEEAGFDNTPVSLNLSTPLTPTLSWSNTIAGVLPTDRKLQNETSYQGAIKADTALAFDDLFLGSSLRLGVGITRNFHEMTQGNEGAFNVRETISQKLDYSLPLGKTWSLDTSFAYSTGWTYLGDLRTKFYAGADLSWNFVKDWTASVGTSNEGNALKPNGRDSNIEFFNDTSSVVKFGLTYVL